LSAELESISPRTDPTSSGFAIERNMAAFLMRLACNGRFPRYKSSRGDPEMAHPLTQKKSFGAK